MGISSDVRIRIEQSMDKIGYEIMLLNCYKDTLNDIVQLVQNAMDESQNQYGQKMVDQINVTDAKIDQAIVLLSMAKEKLFNCCIYL